MNKLKLVCALLALALVASCGGGGSGSGAGAAAESSVDVYAGGAGADAIDRYQGTWASGCIAEGNTHSERETLVITKQSPTTIAVNLTITEYAAANCSGAGVARVETGTVTFVGTKNVGNVTVDKGLVTVGTQTEKQIFLVSGNTVTTGRQAGDGGTLDSEGYPETLDSGFSLTRQ